MRIPKAIFKNAQSLLATSLSLFALGSKHHASHFAALSLEECVKCLMQIDEVKDRFKNKDRNHYKKEELIGFFPYLAGKLSAAYTMKHMINKGILGDDTKIHVSLVKKILESSGMSSKAGLIECLNEYINSEAIQSQTSEYKNNEIRKNSVYVDIENGNLQTPKKRVSDKQITRIMNDAKFAVSLMNMTLYNCFSWLEFFENFPKIYPHPQKEANKMYESLRKHLSNTHNPDLD